MASCTQRGWHLTRAAAQDWESRRELRRGLYQSYLKASNVGAAQFLDVRVDGYDPDALNRGSVKVSSRDVRDPLKSGVRKQEEEQFLFKGWAHAACPSGRGRAYAPAEAGRRRLPGGTRWS